MPDPLAESIELAARVHRGQVDKGDNPYILHCLEVMWTANLSKIPRTIREMPFPEEDWQPEIEVLSAAVLHDAIEDSKPEDRPRVRAEVYAAAGDRAGEAVDALTRGIQESWSNYIERLCEDWIARLVKLADLEHNCDLTRLGHGPTEADLQRVRKYESAKKIIEERETR